MTEANDVDTVCTQVQEAAARVNQPQLADLLTERMLCESPDERIVARDIQLHPFFVESELALVVAEDERKGVERECTVCFDSFHEVYGVMCPQNEHFLCGSCFSDHVKDQSVTMEGRQQRGGRVFCVMHTVKGDGARCYQAVEHPYEDSTVGKVASPAAFTAYTTCRQQIIEQRLANEAEAELKQRVAAELEVLRLLSEEERAVRQCRLHITENILNLRCPNPNGCNQVFVDFNGCFALTCSKCGCGFCAWCLAYCDRNAHAHVRTCAHKLNDDAFYGSVAEFHQAHRQRRQAAVRQYLVRDMYLLSCV
jgi:hypothetical protein